MNSLSLVLIEVVDRSARASEHHYRNRGQVEDDVNDDGGSDQAAGAQQFGTDERGRGTLLGGDEGVTAVFSDSRGWLEGT
jgi:hypothetical protein